MTHLQLFKENFNTYLKESDDLWSKVKTERDVDHASNYDKWILRQGQMCFYLDTSMINDWASAQLLTVQDIIKYMERN